MKRHLVLAGKGLAGTGLSGAVLYLVATVPTHVHVIWPYWVFLAGVLVGVALYLAGQDRAQAELEQPKKLDQDKPPVIQADSQEAGSGDLVAVQTGPAITDRWRLTINDVSSEMLQLQNNAITHPGYTSRPVANPPPSFRIGMRMACSPLDPATPTTSEVRARFLSFLGQPPVMDLIRELTALGDGVAWRARDDNPRHNFAAILSLPDTEEAPVAWARLLLPEEMTRRYGRDFRCAYFVLYVEPRSADGSPAPAASLVSWHQRFSEALGLPASLAEFLAEQLGLSTSADPAAEVGVWLKAPRALTELIDVDGYASVEGSAQSNWYMGFAMTDPGGQRPGGLAEAWLRQLCDSALHLDGYEADLANLRPGTGAGRRLTIKIAQQDLDVWRDLAYIVGLRVEITNTTDNLIRVSSIGIGSDWGRNPPPGDLPVIDDSGPQGLLREVDARRANHYTPELRGYSSVPPLESVSGWVVTWMPRPPAGGTPNLTLSIREAVGHQYLTAIPRTDPQVVRSGGVAADQPEVTVEDRGQSTPNTADVLAERFAAEWAADISLFTKLKSQPSFQEVSAAIRRSAELNLISKHGIRAPLEHTLVYLRIPHPDDWPSDSSIPLHLEERWLEEISVHEWTPDQSFVDAAFSIAAKMRSTFRWEGESSFKPHETFEQFADLLLYGIESIRRGFDGIINRMFQIIGDDWIITEWELIDKEHQYQITFNRFNKDRWMEDMTEKTWLNRNNFQEAFGTSQLLIHNQIFEGRLPPGWEPPNIWPFKVLFGDGTLRFLFRGFGCKCPDGAPTRTRD